MLIINLINHDDKNYKKNLFFKKKTKTPLQRSSFNYNNTVFDVISISEKQVYSDEYTELFKRYKGKILETSCNSVNDYLSGYLYDISQYIKRAYLSQLNNVLKKYKIPSLCLYDDKFVFYDELKNIALQCKSITLYAKENIDMQRFCDYCYINYGLDVYVNESFALQDNTFFVDFTSSFNTKRMIIRGNANEHILTPDKSYLIPNETTKKIMLYGVPLWSACAVTKNI